MEKAKGDLTAEEFRNWLEAILLGHEAKARASMTTRAEEIVNGELRPSLAAFFPGGAFVITIGKVGER